MDWYGPGFVLAIIALCVAAGVINNLIRARHGYPVADDWGGKIARDDPATARTMQLLGQENEKLTGKVSRLEERIAVLERIATDPANRTAREIDALRDR